MTYVSCFNIQIWIVGGVTTSLRNLGNLHPHQQLLLQLQKRLRQLHGLGPPKSGVWLLDVEVNCWVLLSLCVVNVECFWYFLIFQAIAILENEEKHFMWQNDTNDKINAWCQGCLLKWWEIRDVGAILQEVSAAKSTCVSASHFGGHCVLLHFMFSKPLSLAVWGRQEPLRNK